MSLKFGLNLKSKGLSASNKPAPAKRKLLLGEDDDDDGSSKPTKTDNTSEIEVFDFDEYIGQVPARASEARIATRKGQPAGPPTRKAQARKDDPSALANAASLQESERRAKEATDLDATIYDYDKAYDALHARDAAKKAAQQEEASSAQPKYMEALFESADLRKQDQLRARDKVLKREREAEGDEFADKEKFVTGAYKAQQEEVRKAEEEEKKRQEKEDEKRRTVGMLGFHKQMLVEQEKKHREAEEAMKAAAEMAKSGQKVETDEPKEKSEAELAKELNAKGGNIIVNEEGEVADKRQLLTAGLNVVAKPKKQTANPTNASSKNSETGYKPRTALQRGVRERQTAMVADQIEQAAKRKADEEAEEQRKLEHANKSRKTDNEISSAKERYMQRKREAAAAKAAAGK